jgi:hypothetical protein
VAFGDAGHAGNNLAGRTISALESVVLDERGLKRMQLAVARLSFGRGYVRAVASGSEREA